MFSTAQERIEISKAARQKGNEYYKCDKLIAAIAQYNKALVFADDNKEQAALCYGNRSAVYLKLNYFQNQKLRDRRKECLKMMKTKTDKAMKPFDYRAKLSYKPNPKIPFFIDALQLKDDPVIGKYIITTQDLRAGDIIGIIESWQVSVNDPLSDYKLACYNCLNTNNGDLIPGKCNVEYPPLFCSKKCRDEHLKLDKDHEGAHEFEKINLYRVEACNHIATSMVFVHKVFLELYDVFGSVETMRTFYESHEKLKCSFFEFDWSMLGDDPKYQENMLLVLMSELKNFTLPSVSECVAALIHRSSESQSRLVEIRRKQNHENGKFMDQLLDCIHLSFRYSTQIHPALTYTLSAIVIHPFTKCFLKSCDANTFVHYENHDGLKNIVFTVNQPISAGEIVTIPGEGLYYNAAVDVKKCDKVKNCTPCRENWAKMISKGEIIQGMINNVQTSFRYNDPKKVESMLKHRREICNFINENFTDYDYNENPKTRYKIATKKGELEMNMKMMESLAPQVSVAMWNEPDYNLNVSRHILPDSHEILLK